MVQMHVRASVMRISGAVAAGALVAGVATGMLMAPAWADDPAPTESAVPTATPDPAPTYAPGMAPGEHAGWAVVDPTTGQITGGVIVCTPEVCGSGWFAGMRVVLQTLQDPVEAAQSNNHVGNVAGYSTGTYDFATGRWTIPGSNGQILEVPLAYPGADRGGTVHVPTCIANCVTATPTPEPTDSADPGTSPTDSATADPSPSDPTVLLQARQTSRGFTVTLTSPKTRTPTIVTVSRGGTVIKRWTVRGGRGSAVALLMPSRYRGATVTLSSAGRTTAVTTLV